MSSTSMHRAGRYLLAASFIVTAVGFVPWLSRINNLALSPWMPASAVVLAPLGSIPGVAQAGLQALVGTALAAYILAIVVFVGSTAALLVPKEPRPFLTFSAVVIAAYAVLFDLPGYVPGWAITRTSNHAGTLFEIAGFCVIASGRRPLLGVRVFGVAYCLNVAYGLFLRLSHPMPPEYHPLALMWNVESVCLLAAGLCILLGYERRKAAIALAAFAIGSEAYSLIQYPSMLRANSLSTAAGLLSLLGGAALIASLEPVPDPTKRLRS